MPVNTGNVKYALGRAMFRATSNVREPFTNPAKQSENKMIALAGPLVRYLYTSGSAPQVFGPHIKIVSQGGGGDNTTINGAIAKLSGVSTNTRGVIVILPGMYNEQISFTQNIALVGVDKNSCIIINSGNGDTITTGATSVTSLSNLSIFHINGTGASISTVGIDGVNEPFLDVSNCLVACDKTSTKGAISAHGGLLSIYESTINSSGSYAINYFGEITTPTLYDRAFVKNTIVSGSTAGIRISNWPVGTTFKIQDCDIFAGAGPSIIYNDPSTVLIDRCRVESSFKAAIEVSSGTTEAEFQVTNSHIICNSGSADLVSITSGTATIGFYNNVINSDDKPADLTLAPATPAFWFGSSNIARENG